MLSIGIPLLAGVTGFAIAWIVPPYYKSEIRIILDTGSKTTSISSLMKNAAPTDLLSSLGPKPGNENEDLYIDIIDGRDVHWATIEKFRLDTVYKGVKYKEALLKRFYNDIKINPDELTGIISCSYEAQNRVLARDLVRFVVEEANAKYIKLKRERALQTIEQLNFFKQRMITSADSVSEILIDFYRSNNLLELGTQLKLTMTALAGYEEQIKNIKINESMAVADNSTATELRKRRQILEREVQKLRGDFSKDYIPSKTSIYINYDWAVEKVIELQKLETNFGRFFTTLEMIEREIVLEESNAARNLPVIQIVQDAYLADYKSRPKRVTWALIGSLISAIFVYSISILRGILNKEIPCEEKTRDNFIKLLKACLP